MSLIGMDTINIYPVHGHGLMVMEIDGTMVIIMRN